MKKLRLLIISMAFAGTLSSVAAEAARFDLKCKAVFKKDLPAVRGVAVTLTKDGKEDSQRPLYFFDDTAHRNSMLTLCEKSLNTFTCSDRGVLKRDGKKIDEYWDVYHTATYKCQKSRMELTFQELWQASTKFSQPLVIESKEHLDLILASSPEVPTLVEFWAEWCVPCLKMNRELENLAVILAGQVRIVKVDIGGNSAAQLQEGSTLPQTHLFYKNQRKIIYEYQNTLNLLNWIKENT